MTARLSGSKRLALALGAFAAVGALATAAAFTDHADVHVDLDGTQNRFDIVVAGQLQADAASWTPTDEQWQQGNPDAVQLGFGGDQGVLLAPGGSFRTAIAVRNDSPRLPARISLTISDPLPRGTETNPETGTYVELFDQLVFTVADADGDVLVDHVPAASLTSYEWADPFASGASATLTVTIELPDSVDNRWQQASTDVLFSFQAVQS